MSTTQPNVSESSSSKPRTSATDAPGTGSTSKSRSDSALSLPRATDPNTHTRSIGYRPTISARSPRDVSGPSHLPLRHTALFPCSRDQNGRGTARFVGVGAPLPRQPPSVREWSPKGWPKRMRGSCTVTTDYIRGEADGALRLETHSRKARRRRDTLTRRLGEDNTSLAGELAHDHRAAADQESEG